ncbi:LOW QUALITY PROTEIN: hypothetical protein HID58_040348 [Brassica napus]|uniref:RNA polymerase Rpb4/RPC9 core domain-containing protein n=1 Tax=Brassica napus TaxID=3708 RepID=A0ABQ8B7V1_BRANA|nr:LOW QUALITY PROTEIN: hypothetical protein HID58_040348 [Brassica napus]
MDKKKGGCLAPSTSLMRRLPNSYVLGMLPVLKQQMDGAMAHAPSSHHARVPACHDENASLIFTTRYRVEMLVIDVSDPPCSLLLMMNKLTSGSAVAASMITSEEYSFFFANSFLRILSRHQLIEFELCILGNLCPETAEEAVAMVPFLKLNY